MRPLIAPSALALALALGCGGSTARPPATAAGATTDAGADGPDDGELAPTPFSAEQIRDATRVGRTYRFRQEEESEPSREYRIEFVAVDPEGCTIRRTNLGPDGQSTSPPQESRATWTELRDHAQFPRARTTITRETIEVPAGRFDAVKYTVQARMAGHLTAQRYWFATSMPGAPVRVTHERDGVVIMSMTLLEHRDPQGPGTGDRAAPARGAPPRATLASWAS